MEKHYRVVVDFSHSADPEELQQLFEKIADAIMDVLDPHIGDNPDCERDFLILGADVSYEYASADENDVSRFVKDLGDGDVMDKFLPEVEEE